MTVSTWSLGLLSYWCRQPRRPLSTTSAATASAALQMLGISLLLFRASPKSTAAKLVRAATMSLSGARQATQQGWIGANLPIILMYSPVHVFFTLWVLSFMFMPRWIALGLWVGYLVPYYVFTQMGNPAHTGKTCLTSVLHVCYVCHWPQLSCFICMCASDYS